MIPPDMAAVMIEAIDPAFFSAAREESQAEVGGFEDLEALLGPAPAGPGEQGGPPGGQGPPPGNQPVPSTGQDQGASGGTVEQGGFMPPQREDSLMIETGVTDQDIDLYLRYERELIQRVREPNFPLVAALEFEGRDRGYELAHVAALLARLPRGVDWTPGMR